MSADDEETIGSLTPEDNEETTSWRVPVDDEEDNGWFVPVHGEDIGCWFAPLDDEDTVVLFVRSFLSQFDKTCLPLDFLLAFCTGVPEK